MRLVLGIALVAALLAVAAWALLGGAGDGAAAAPGARGAAGGPARDAADPSTATGPTGAGEDAATTALDAGVDDARTEAAAEDVPDDGAFLTVLVTDEARTPVPGARVEVHLYAGEDPVPIGVGTSGPDGRARFDAGPLAGRPLETVVERDALLVATAPGYRREANDHTLTWNRDRTGLRPLRVELRRGGDIGFRVVDEAGAPVADAVVVAVAEPNLNGTTQGMRSEVDGFVELDPAWGLDLARLEGWHPTGAGVATFDPPVRMEAGVALPDLVLRTRGTIEGVLRLPGGARAGECRVAVAPAGELPDEIGHLDGDEEYDGWFETNGALPDRRWPLRVVADADGDFRVAGLEPGAYDLVPIWRGEHGKRWAPFETLGPVVRARTGATDVALEVGRALLVARVRDPGGHPLVGADVELFQVEPDEDSHDDPRWGSFESWGGRGARAEGLEAEARFLLVPGESYALDVSAPETEESGLEFVAPSAGEVMERTVILWRENEEGRVRFTLRGEDGVPLTATHARLLVPYERADFDEVGHRALDADGVLDEVKSRTWRAWVTHDVADAESFHLRGGLSPPFRVPPGELVEVEVEVPLAGRVDVELVDAWTSTEEEPYELRVWARRLGHDGEPTPGTQVLGHALPGTTLRGEVPLPEGTWRVSVDGVEVDVGDAAEVRVTPGTVSTVVLTAGR